MYQLYYYPLNASMAPHFMLEALNVDFQLMMVDRKNNEHKSARYLALNPLGRIPTLVDGNVNFKLSGDGLVIFESSAICIHLAEMHPKANLIPKIGDSNRSLFFQWMMYLTNTLQAELMIYCYPQKYTTSVNALENIIETQESKITAMLEWLNKELEHKQYLVGNMISACDYFLFMLAVWADELTHPPLSFKYLGQYLCRLAKRDELIRACKTESFSLNDYQGLT